MSEELDGFEKQNILVTLINIKYKILSARQRPFETLIEYSNRLTKLSEDYHHLGEEARKNLIEITQTPAQRQFLAIRAYLEGLNYNIKRYTHPAHSYIHLRHAQLHAVSIAKALRDLEEN